MSIHLLITPTPVTISFVQLPRRALEIHQMRPDLQQAFDLTTANGRQALYWWYYMHGFQEMWLDFQPSEDLKGPVNTPVDYLPVHGPLPVTWLMRAFWLRGAVPGSARDRSKRTGRWHTKFRHLFGGAKEPSSRREQENLLSWYFCCGQHEANLGGFLTPEQAAVLVRANESTHGAPCIVAMVHDRAPDLHAIYPDASSIEWHEWCATTGQHRFPILAHPLIRQELFSTSTVNEKRRTSFCGKPDGINLIGHAGSRSGVGEDLRMAARALEAAQIPFVVYDVPPSTGVASEELCLSDHVSDRLPFRVNLFCMAGMETVTMLSGRRDLLNGKVNIGFWPWELPEWPRLWAHAPRLMHELWASTHFTAEAYRRSTGVPVWQVPMAVEVDKTEQLERRDFGLPDDCFLFGFAFDGHSSFTRKNPEGCIAAFRLAFPQGNENAALVLKGLRVDDHPTWRKLEALAAADPRIILLSASLTRGALLDLYRSIDCFVSLHRSEGFGRNIAECMLLGKPVIATAYSGNVDFTRADTTALVNANLCEVNAGEYPFGTGQIWAAPSIEQAALHMRRMISDEPWRTQIAKAGKKFIETHYAPAVVGENFRLQLRRITEMIDNKEYIS